MTCQFHSLVPLLIPFSIFSFSVAITGLDFIPEKEDRKRTSFSTRPRFRAPEQGYSCCSCWRWTRWWRRPRRQWRRWCSRWGCSMPSCAPSFRSSESGTSPATENETVIPVLRKFHFTSVSSSDDESVSSRSRSPHISSAEIGRLIRWEWKFSEKQLGTLYVARGWSLMADLWLANSSVYTESVD